MSPVPTESYDNLDDALRTTDATASAGKRTWLIEVILGSAMLALFFLIDRLRPRKQVETTNEPLAVRADGAPTASRQPRDQSVSVMPSDYPAPPAGYEMTSSIWPVVVAAGITFCAFGVVTNITFSIVGFLVLIGGVTGWVGELIRE